MCNSVLLLWLCINLLPETGYAASCRAAAGGQSVKLGQVGVVISARVDMSVVPGDSVAARRRVRQSKSATKRGLFRPIARSTDFGDLLLAGFGAVLFLFLGIALFIERNTASLLSSAAVPAGLAFIALGIVFTVLFFHHLHWRKQAKQQTASMIYRLD